LPAVRGHDQKAAKTSLHYNHNMVAKKSLLSKATSTYNVEATL